MTELKVNTMVARITQNIRRRPAKSISVNNFRPLAQAAINRIN